MISYLILFVLLFVAYKNIQKALILTVVLYPTLQLFSLDFGWNVVTVMSLVYFLSVLTDKNNKLKDFPVLAGILFLFSSILITEILTFSGKIAGVYLPFTEIVLCISFWFLFKPQPPILKYLFNTVIAYGFVLTIYGFYEAFSTNNPFIDFIRQNVSNISEQSSDYVRFGIYRSQSLTVWCSTFGVTCSFMATLLLNSVLRGWIERRIFINLLIVFCYIGVLVSGSRTTIVLALIMSLSVFSFLTHKKTVLTLIILVSLSSYFFGEYFEQVIDSFFSLDSSGASTTDLRERQLDISLYYWANNPIFGNGIGYINQVMKIEDGLYGAESIVFKMLVDRGVYGLLTFIVFLFCIIVFLFRSKCKYLIFIPLAFLFGKVTSLLPGFNDAYILCFALLLYILDRYHSTDEQD